MHLIIITLLHISYYLKFIRIYQEGKTFNIFYFQTWFRIGFIINSHFQISKLNCMRSSELYQDQNCDGTLSESLYLCKNLPYSRALQSEWINNYCINNEHALRNTSISCSVKIWYVLFAIYCKTMLMPRYTCQGVLPRFPYTLVNAKLLISKSEVLYTYQLLMCSCHHIHWMFFKPKCMNVFVKMKAERERERVQIQYLYKDRQKLEFSKFLQIPIFCEIAKAHSQVGSYYAKFSLYSKIFNRRMWKSIPYNIIYI